MRPNRQHKPDSLLFLFVVVTLGMVITSIAQAESYLFGQQAESQVGISESDGRGNDFQSKLLPSYKHKWLQLPGTESMKTSFKGGMAHFLYEGDDDNKTDNILPGNTRLIFSLGVEESEGSLSSYASVTKRRLNHCQRSRLSHSTTPQPSYYSSAHERIVTSKSWLHSLPHVSRPQMRTTGVS